MSYFLKYLKYKKKYLKQKDLQIGGKSSQNCVYVYNEALQKMENAVCPGLKYFNEIIDVIDKNPNAIYMMFGHGCDLYEELLEVPVNCRYITKVACGLKSYNDPVNNILNDFLNNKFDICNFDKYEMLSNDGESVYFDEYKTHIGGQNYVNSITNCFLNHGHGTKGISGLRRLGDPVVCMPNLKNLNYPSEPDFFTLRQYLVHCFEGSLFPTTQQINKLLDESSIENSREKLAGYDWTPLKLNEWEKLINNNFKIDYASIMDRLPGTFINDACRPLCKGIHDVNQATQFIKLARQNSNRRIYKVSELPKEIMEQIDKIDISSSISCIKKNLKKLENP